MDTQASLELVLASERRLLAENAKLRAAVSRIDAINDNPARFNSEINKVCDGILRPHLAE